MDRTERIQAAFRRFEGELRAARWRAIDSDLEAAGEPPMTSAGSDGPDVPAAAGATGAPDKDT